MKEFFIPVMVGISGAAGFALLSWIAGKIVVRFILPAELQNRMSVLEKKFDGFITRYDEGAERNKKSQQALFKIQDYQFDVMKAHTGAVRELAKSVCNGNKPFALELCDDADEKIEEGRKVHRDILYQ